MLDERSKNHENNYCFLTLAVFAGWKLPLITSDQQALLAVALLASLKVVNAVVHSLLGPA